MSNERKLCTQHTPPQPGPSMRIERLKAGAKWTICLLGPMWGTWTHWHGEGKRSQGCFADERNDCDGCKRGLPRRWKGYLHVWHYETREECFLEITPVVGKQMEAQVPYGVQYRGIRMTIKRGQGDKARLECTVLPAEHAIDDMPNSKDPERILRSLWSEEFRLRKRVGPDLNIVTEAS